MARHRPGRARVRPAGRRTESLIARSSRRSVMDADLTENPVVFFDGRFVPLAEARVSVLTHALQYGTAVFDGIRGYWNAGQQELFLLRPLEHYDRWGANCGILRIGVGLS